MCLQKHTISVLTLAPYTGISLFFVRSDWIEHINIALEHLACIAFCVSTCIQQSFDTSIISSRIKTPTSLRLPCSKSFFTFTIWHQIECAFGTRSSGKNSRSPFSIAEHSDVKNILLEKSNLNHVNFLCNTAMYWRPDEWEILLLAILNKLQVS